MPAFSSSSASALSGVCDVDLGLEDRYEPGVEDPRADLELLVEDRVDARPGSARLTTERIFVPNTPARTASASSGSSRVIGFISWTPSDSSARPLSTLRNGTTCLSSQR